MPIPQYSALSASEACHSHHDRISIPQPPQKPEALSSANNCHIHYIPRHMICFRFPILPTPSPLSNTPTPARVVLGLITQQDSNATLAQSRPLIQTADLIRTRAGVKRQGLTHLRGLCSVMRQVSQRKKIIMMSVRQHSLQLLRRVPRNTCTRFMANPRYVTFHAVSYRMWRTQKKQLL